MSKINPNLTEEELDVLRLLSSSWTEFTLLPQITFNQDQMNDFRQAIHTCQRIIATRVAKRLEPDVWSMVLTND